MRHLKQWFILLLLSLVIGMPASAQQRGTADEAKALVEKALAHIKVVGVPKAYADFTATGKWQDRDLYIFAYSFDGTNLAFGDKPGMVGKNLFDLKDANGVYVIRELAEVAKTKGSGWFNYSWSDPITKKIQPKSSYVIRVPGADAFIGAGIYK